MAEENKHSEENTSDEQHSRKCPFGSSFSSLHALLNPPTILEFFRKEASTADDARDIIVVKYLTDAYRLIRKNQEERVVNLTIRAQDKDLKDRVFKELVNKGWDCTEDAGPEDKFVFTVKW